MNYYPHHIGDYLRDTAHLTATEDGIYRRMLDLYYASEKPLPLSQEWLCRLLRANVDIEREAVDIVLKEFFDKKDDGWHNKRADVEIRKGRARIKAAKANGKSGGRPITQEKPSGLPVGSQKEALQKPKAKSQNQIKEHAEVSRLNGAHHSSPVVDNSEILEKLPLREGGEFEVRRSLVAELEPLYPAVDIPTTLREMRAWLLLNSERRKTKKGVRRFIGNWLQGEQEKHGG